MEQFPKDSIEEIWNNTTDRSWEGLRETLLGYNGHLAGISKEEAEMVLQMAHEMEETGQPYPKSFSELYNFLNEDIVEETADY
jgi:hypothetical protein